MAKKKTRIIEVVQISIRHLNESLSNPNFSSIITNESFKDKIFTFEGKEYSLKILSISSVYVIGLVITRQLLGLPPKGNRKNEFSKLPLENDEGLGFANVFLYYKAKNILYYEVNKNGCFIESFKKMIYDFSLNAKLEPFDLQFTTVFEKNQYNKIIAMREYKQLSIDIALPNQLIADFKDSNDALGAAILQTGAMNADSFTFDIKYDARNYMGIPRSYIKDTTDKIRKLLKKPEKRHFIKVFRVKGYSDDAENPQKLLPVDLLGDVFRKEIKITELRLNSDLQESERKTQIIELFNKTQSEIDAIFG